MCVCAALDCRHAGQARAAVMALEHATTLKPQSAGPAHAEIMLIHMEQLDTAFDTDEETELTRLAQKAHATAARLNPKLAWHVLRTSYPEVGNDGSFADFLAAAFEVRRKRIAHENDMRFSKSRPRHLEAGETLSITRQGNLVDLETCAESRARRDVLRLKGLRSDADALNDTLEEALSGRMLPSAPWESPAQQA